MLVQGSDFFSPSSNDRIGGCGCVCCYGCCQGQSIVLQCMLPRWSSHRHRCHKRLQTFTAPSVIKSSSISLHRLNIGTFDFNKIIILLPHIRLLHLSFWKINMHRKTSTWLPHDQSLECKERNINTFQPWPMKSCGLFK